MPFKIKSEGWLVIAGVVLFGCVIIAGQFWAVDLGTPQPSSSDVRSNTPSSTSAIDGVDDKTKSELAKLAWVRGVYISPGTLNVGVDALAKDWSSSMIQSTVCGIVRRTENSPVRIRFVDADKVIYQQASPSGAEIVSFDCK